MKLSVSSWIYGNQSVEHTFKILKDLGFNGIELTGEPEIYSIEQLNCLSKKNEIEIISIAGIYPWPTNDRDISSPTLSVREKAIDYLKRCCLFAKNVNAGIIIVSPTPVGKVLPSTSFTNENEWRNAVLQERDFAVCALKEAGEYAKEMNVILAIEPLNRYETFLINNVQQALEFISDVNSSHVRLHLDTFHMNIEEANLIDAIKEGKEYLVNIHIADSNRQAVGRGHINFNSILKTLVDIKYRGPLTLEPLPPISNPYIVTKYDSFRPIFNDYLSESFQKIMEIIM